MLITQKCQYALRALFALGRQWGRGPVKIARVAEEQSIPFRFLEVILSQLKQQGFVESRRGAEGGYLLAVKPAEIRVGDIVRFIDGPVIPDGTAERSAESATDDIFAPIWKRAHQAVFEVFDGITIGDLIEADEARRAARYPDYTI
jgi:Rrf2 family protein